MKVGCFEEPDFPHINGRYRYMPYRGPGHYFMQTERRGGRSPRCCYDASGVLVSFMVLDCPEFGVLELSDFDLNARLAPGTSSQLL